MRKYYCASSACCLECTLNSFPRPHRLSKLNRKLTCFLMSPISVLHLPCVCVFVVRTKVTICLLMSPHLCYIYHVCVRRAYVLLTCYYWIELNWIELNWIELNWIELNWIELNWIELNWMSKAIPEIIDMIEIALFGVFLTQTLLTWMALWKR